MEKEKKQEKKKRRNGGVIIIEMVEMEIKSKDESKVKEEKKREMS